MGMKAKAGKKVAGRFRPRGARHTRVWLAMGTLAAYSVSGKMLAATLPAEGSADPQRSEKNSVAANTLPVRRFDLAPGPIATVAAAFAKATGIRIDLINPSLGNISSPGVSGIYSDEQALRKLLEGTGLSYRFVGPLAVTLQIQSVSTSVGVTANASGIVTIPKYTEPLRNTPQTINVVPQEIIQDQGATTLRDTLRNFAGISIAAGEGGAQGDNLTIRGFTARNDIFLDGMRDFGSYYRDPFNTEQVEVLQGPSSITFGRGSTGGVVNQQTKAPGLDKFITGSLQVGTDLTRRVTADFNHPVSALGQNTAFRLNVMGDEGNVAGRDAVENRRFGVAPSLAFGLGTPTRFTLSYFHQTGDDLPDYGIPWLFNGPAPVNRSNFYGFQNSGGDYLRTYDDVGTAKLEHDFNSSLSFRNQVRYANYVRDVRITEPQIAGTVKLGTPLTAISVNRHEIAVDSTETALDEQADLMAHVKTGFIQHSIVTGFETTRETSNPVRPNYVNVPTTGLLNPNEDQSFAGTPVPSSNVHTTAVSVAGYLMDDMKLGRHWELTGGFRFDRFGADYKQTVAPAAAFSRVDYLPSWRGALVYKPNGKGSIYFSSGTSFNPSAESLSLTAGNANLPPEKNITYEAGTKWDLLSSKLSLSGALFRTDKTNAREPDPTNPQLNVLAGSQRVDGLQFQATGRLTSRWQLLTGYALLDSKVVSSRYYPLAVGAQLANVPRNTFTFWNTYNSIWHHIDVGAGGQFVDSRTASSTAPLDPVTKLVKQVPSYWVFNAMARYPFSDRIDLQANVYNIANRYFYDQLHPGHIVLGPGRSALIGLNFKF
jgi:catecholate siderophore receptor